MGRYIDLTGKQYGRLTVLYRTQDHISKSGRPAVVFHCRCTCGKECDVMKLALVKGYTKSCGCLRSEETKKRRTKRDDISRKLRIIYRHMCERCYDEADKRYERYGGRGIAICDEWIEEDGMERFIEWARNNGYSIGLTIDRIDNNGNYSPTNCRWTTPKEQSNNRSTNTMLTVDGTTKTIAQWLDFLGVKSTRLYYYDEDRKVEFVREKIKQKNLID